ncbi:RAD52 motif-containing protein 1-like [Mercenaria mercenaria]|uniref:RAD52 motif-containing protein 1-like n=1 Tax=Mercenaria mercenaria TaxID=6596 RepID=UPI00234E3F1F|nr:RAD52 motif-containing protein 1-like [Mercenaria mercenaria]
MSSHPTVEIIDFTRPDGSRKNLFISSIPAVLHEDDVVVELRRIFDPYGLVYGVQVYPTKWKSKQDSEQVTGETTSGYYAFVTFYSAIAATAAKDDLRGVVMLGDHECKIAFAKRKKDTIDKHQLYFTRCYELIGYYLGFNSWSTSIKTLFEDKASGEETVHTKTVKYVCLMELKVLDLKTDGIGVWQETFSKTEPMSRIQATCKCKKLCHQRAIENAFSKLLLVTLSNGKAMVELDTTKPEFRCDNIPEDQLVKVNELDVKPESEAIMEDITDDLSISNKISAGEMDDINLHILQELEEDMSF